MRHAALLAKVMQSVKLLHMCNISYNHSFVNAAHKRIMPMQYDAILGHWKVLESLLGFFSSWLPTQANDQRSGCCMIALP